MTTTSAERAPMTSDVAVQPLRRSKAAFRRTMFTCAAVLGLWCTSVSFYAVDVTEYAVVTRFGRVVRVVDEPGLHVAAPTDRVARLDRRTLFSRAARSEYLTTDKKNIVVESLVVWRIVDPVRFLATVGARGTAEDRLSEAVSSEIGSVLGREPAAVLILPDPAGNRYAAAMATIESHVAASTRAAYGIELVGLGLRRLSLPEQNREHVFDRMKAERAKIAKENRSGGELEAKRITARADREKAGIEAEAAGEVGRIRAEADAAASRAYGEAFSRDPGFYRLVRTLDAYGKILDDKTTLFLPPDAEVLRLLSFDRPMSGMGPGGRFGADGEGRPPPAADSAGSTNRDAGTPGVGRWPR
jgi:modulator of FtsH protease HflC